MTASHLSALVKVYNLLQRAEVLNDNFLQLDCELKKREQFAFLVYYFKVKLTCSLQTLQNMQIIHEFLNVISDD